MNHSVSGPSLASFSFGSSVLCFLLSLVYLFISLRCLCFFFFFPSVFFFFFSFPPSKSSLCFFLCLLQFLLFLLLLFLLRVPLSLICLFSFVFFAFLRNLHPPCAFLSSPSGTFSHILPLPRLRFSFATSRLAVAQFLPLPRLPLLPFSFFVGTSCLFPACFFSFFPSYLLLFFPSSATSSYFLSLPLSPRTQKPPPKYSDAEDFTRPFPGKAYVCSEV